MTALEPVPGTPVPGSPVPGTLGEILVVEDNPNSLTLLSDLLTNEGYSVRQAPDGDLALWTVQSRAPELILLDIRMPGLDGFEVCRRLKADPVTAAIPVIFLSALDDVEDKVRGLTLGAVDYITKPHHPAEVLSRVRTHLSLVRLTRALAAARLTLEQKVAERTATLEAREREMTRIIAALDMAADGIMILDADNRITYANHTMMETFGARAIEEIIGHRSEEIRGDSGALFDLAELTIARRAVQRCGTWRGELTLRRSKTNDTPASLLVHLRALPDGGRVGVATDITETRRRAEEQKRLEQQLEQARKLEALGQLAGGIAHDFNNLLGAILGFAQFIVEDSAADCPQHRYATRIVKAGLQAKSLIGQILAFSHNKSADAEAVDIMALLEETLSILHATVAPTTQIQITPPASGSPERLGGNATGWLVHGFRTQLTQLIINLCINANAAIKGQPGTITITISAIGPADPDFILLAQAARSDADNQARVAAWRDEAGWIHAGFGLPQPEAHYLVLSVTDTGEGMAFDVATRIFEPFFTTMGRTGGTGLGLAMVQSIVLNHQGGLLVHTHPGIGSRFDVLLPLATACDAPAAREREREREAQTTATTPPAEPPAEPRAPSSPSTDQGSILLVDDSTEFGDMLMTALFRLGYEISVCDDPHDAIAYVQEDAAAWDLVITDQAMPTMSGTALVQAIKAIRPDLPCILCTAFLGDFDEDSARRAGADGFATKPLDLGLFALTVANIIARRAP